MCIRDRRGPESPVGRLLAWQRAQLEANRERYGSHLYSRSAESALHVTEVKPVYLADALSLIHI